MKAPILIVEDSSAMRLFIRTALEDGGAHSVVEAESGLSGLRALSRSRFGLVILDINMPDLNGLELIRFIRSSEPHGQTPVVLISSEASERDRDKGKHLGANQYLAKPFSAEQLLTVVRDLGPETLEG